MFKYAAALVLLLMPSQVLAAYPGATIAGWKIVQNNNLNCTAYNTSPLTTAAQITSLGEDRTRFVFQYALSENVTLDDRPLYSLNLAIVNPGWQTFPQYGGEYQKIGFYLRGGESAAMGMEGRFQRVIEPSINLRGWGYVLRTRLHMKDDMTGSDRAKAIAGADEVAGEILDAMGNKYELEGNIGSQSLGRYVITGWGNVATELRRCASYLYDTPDMGTYDASKREVMVDSNAPRQ